MIDYEKVFRIILYVVLIIVAVLFIYAFLWMYHATNALSNKQIPLPNKGNFEVIDSDDDEYMDESSENEPTKYPRRREYKLSLIHI